ncbi:MAG: hypothetical protein AAFY10_14595, partial [Pseudomonadota bacterium]
PRGYVVGWAQPGAERWRVDFSMAETRGGFVRLVPPQSIPTPEEEPALLEPVPEDLALNEAPEPIPAEGGQP